MYRIKCEHCINIVERRQNVKRAVCYRCKVQKQLIAREKKKSVNKSRVHYKKKKV